LEVRRQDLSLKLTEGIALEEATPVPTSHRDGGGRLARVEVFLDRNRDEVEPIERVRSEGEDVGRVGDLGERLLADDLDGESNDVLTEVELDGLREARQVRDDQGRDRLGALGLGIGTEEREDGVVAR